MKVNEIRDLNAGELGEKLASLKQELFNLRFQHATGQLENPMRIKEVDRARQDGAARARKPERLLGEELIDMQRKEAL